MTTVQDILDFLETVCPLSGKVEWDHTGFQLGSRTKAVGKILLALDPFPLVCEEAARCGADLLLTHHPLIFNPTDRITDDDTTGQSVLILARHGISAISAHTNLDCADGGINDLLAQLVGLQNITPVAGDEWHLLRQGTVENQELTVFMDKVKAALGTPVLRYVDGGRAVHRVAVGGGSCGSELWLAKAANCDTFITADVKYNQFWDGKAAGINIIDAGHFYTENPIIAALAHALQKAFPEIQVEIAKSHNDCMKFYG